jgi:N-acetylglucosaminyldiphosphoundecaprenol N-acetyl-beta-D-mannosaminyltransferase
MKLEIQELYDLKLVSSTLEEFVEYLSEGADKSSNCKFFIIPVNAHLVVLRYENEEFFNILQSDSLIVPDGTPIVWFGKLIGKPLKSQIRGRELFIQLCRESIKNNLSIYLLGDTQETLERTSHRLKEQFPTIRIAGFYSPSFPFEIESDESNFILEEVNKSGADILFVALGAPKQEKWIARNRHLLKPRVLMGAGASFRFFTGQTVLPPRLFEELGLEWLWRLLQEPRRLFWRYTIVNLKFVYHSLKFIINTVIRK